MNDSTVKSLTSRVEIEINMVWARNNPELFFDTYDKFFEEHPEKEWKASISVMLSGFMTLVARRKGS